MLLARKGGRRRCGECGNTRCVLVFFVICVPVWGRVALELLGVAITAPTRVVGAWNVIRWMVHPVGMGGLGVYSWFHFWLTSLGSNSRLFSVHFCSCKMGTRVVNLFYFGDSRSVLGSFQSASYILISQGTSN